MVTKRSTIVDEMRNHANEWVRAIQMASTDTGYSPREVKARALYYQLIGYSSRQTEALLRRDFPGKKVPPFGVIARWNRAKPANHFAARRLAGVVVRVAELLEEYTDNYDPATGNMMEVFDLYERSSNLYYRSRDTLLWQ